VFINFFTLPSISQAIAAAVSLAIQKNPQQLNSDHYTIFQQMRSGMKACQEGDIFDCGDPIPVKSSLVRLEQVCWLGIDNFNCD